MANPADHDPATMARLMTADTPKAALQQALLAAGFDVDPEDVDSAVDVMKYLVGYEVRPIATWPCCDSPIHSVTADEDSSLGLRPAATGTAAEAGTPDPTARASGHGNTSAAADPDRCPLPFPHDGPCHPAAADPAGYDGTMYHLTRNEYQAALRRAFEDGRLAGAPSDET